MYKYIVSRLTILFIFILISIVIFGCEEPNEPPPASDCEVNHTASVRFENHSSRYTYDVIWDGANMGSISPGQHIDHIVAAGNHSLVYKYTNTNNYASSYAYPNLAQCACETFFCN